MTERLAEWIVQAEYNDVPPAGVQRVKERVLDSLGTQLAGMTVPTGQTIAGWVRSQQAKEESTVVAGGFKTSTHLAALVNATAGHALDFDDSATFSSHPSNPLTAAVLAVGEKLGSSGQDLVLAFLVGWEVICQTNKPCETPAGNTLLIRGWHNQGFQPALGCAAAASKLMRLDLDQTRMAIGNAASTMSGLHKNCGSDTKPFHGGNPPMHGIMAAELVASGFTANKDILDGSWGAARLMGLEGGEAEKVLDGLGTWDLATHGSMLKLHACNGGGFWAQAALENFLRRRPTSPDEIDSIEVHISGFLMDELPHHLPQTGLEAKFSIEYDLATIALTGRAGVREYTDAMVRRPEAQDFMKRVSYVPLGGDLWRGTRIVITLNNGEKFEETATKYHGQADDPLSETEIADKFQDCAEGVLAKNQRGHVVDLCWHLDQLDNVAKIADVVRADAT